MVIAQRRERAELIGRAKGGLVDPTGVHGEFAGDRHELDERGPPAESVPAGDRELPVVQPKVLQRNVGTGMMTADGLDRFAVVGHDPTLQSTGVGAQMLQ